MQWNPMPEVPFWNMDVWVLVGLLFYAWVVQRYFRPMSILFQALFDFRNFDKPLRSAFRDGNPPSSWVNFLFSFLPLTAYAWFVCIVCLQGPDWVRPGLEGLLQAGWSKGQALMLLSAGLIAAWYAAKFLVLHLVSAVFDEPRFASFAWKTGMYYDLAYSLFCLPVLALCFHADGRVLAGVVPALFILYCMIFFVRMLRFMVEGRAYSRFSPLHIFVYLCALEILPFACLWRIYFAL